MKRRAPDGFTLLELLLAISILSLITGSILGGIHLGRRTWEASRAGEALDDVESAVRAATELISRSFLIESEPTTQATPGTSGSFRGAPDACRFIALSEGGGQWGGLIVTEIGVDNGPDGPELAVWTKPYRPTDGIAPARAGMRKTVILSNLADVQFSFFGSQQQAPMGLPQQGPPPAWSQSWKSQTGVPILVSVKIAANRRGHTLAADATVALRQQ
ncbi:prepilin-type N-terminal cleavage/methylation domain-containing protein [Methylocystis sp. Sn-Cys]|uniref:prepilin-type N-terminal cleavage/methylation domain-containing protein n=1 Tax=Methylocystis sp. Sn-Cys TaxID=1701263 RepID=UPI001921ED83|nr:prepilin-type N-terminal cleavage/methylation domain-containing protein [Methylocystis sp. Sn-Cys]MBL1256604.1 prepilin-type N-terminal cleavage/methylation domain-containing protein [Methylocystis sp. Sn-Cys]